MTCAWTPNDDCFTEGWATAEDWQRDLALDLASATLHRLTGYRVGGCPVTVRPTRRGCCFVPTLGHSPLFVNPGMNASGQWVNNCGCREHRYDDVALVGPVGKILEVTVDGVAVSAGDYRLDGHTLVWEGTGDAPWRLDQDPSLPAGAPGTFLVTYLNSYEPDATARCMVSRLAEEFLKSLTGDKKCRLPNNVTSITRQGISMELVTGAFADGRTGLLEVDSWLALWNPGNLRQQSKVWYPGVGQTR